MRRRGGEGGIHTSAWACRLRCDCETSDLEIGCMKLCPAGPRKPRLGKQHKECGWAPLAPSAAAPKTGRPTANSGTGRQTTAESRMLSRLHKQRWLAITARGDSCALGQCERMRHVTRVSAPEPQWIAWLRLRSLWILPALASVPTTALEEPSVP